MYPDQVAVCSVFISTVQRFLSVFPHRIMIVILNFWKPIGNVVFERTKEEIEG